MNHGCRSDAAVSASIPARRSASTSKASSRTSTMARAAARRPRPPGRPDARRSPRRSSTRRPRPRAGAGSTRIITSPAPMSRKPLAMNRADEVGRRIVERRRPDVRPPTERREQHEHLGQPPVEGTGFDRPAQPFEPVPERLRVDRIVEQDRVAEVAQRRGPGWRGRAPRGAAAGASCRRRSRGSALGSSADRVVIGPP